MVKHGVRYALAMAGSLGLLVAPQRARATVDSFTLHAQPANALVMPFDLVDRETFFLVSNVAGVSPAVAGSIPAVSTHWSFWNRGGAHLFDANICLTLNDTIAVDGANVASVDAANNQIGPAANLSGERGFVVVTAYATNEICDPGALTGLHLVDGALTGRFVISDLNAGDSIGDNALGFATKNGSFTNLPDLKLSPPEDSSSGFVNVQTFNPAILDSSVVIFVALKEKAGPAPWTSELGPLRPKIKAWSVFYDNLEIATSLPDLAFRAMRFVPIGPSPDGLIPDSISELSSGHIRLNHWTYGQNAKAVGCDTFVYAWVAAHAGGGIIDFAALADYKPSDATCP